MNLVLFFDVQVSFEQLFVKTVERCVRLGQIRLHVFHKLFDADPSLFYLSFVKLKLFLPAVHFGIIAAHILLHVPNLLCKDFECCVRFLDVFSLVGSHIHDFVLHHVENVS